QHQRRMGITVVLGFLRGVAEHVVCIGPMARATLARTSSWHTGCACQRLRRAERRVRDLFFCTPASWIEPASGTSEVWVHDVNGSSTLLRQYFIHRNRSHRPSSSSCSALSLCRPLFWMEGGLRRCFNCNGIDLRYLEIFPKPSSSD